MRYTLLIVCMVLGGCAGIRVVNLGEVARRASIEMACPADQITVEALERKTLCIGNDDVCSTSAVARGCGKQAIYVRVVVEDQRGPWARNSDIQTVPEAQKVPPEA